MSPFVRVIRKESVDMQGAHGRLRGWRHIGLVCAVALGAGCNLLFGINEYSNEGGAAGSGGQTGTAGSGGQTGTAGNGGQTGTAGNGGVAGNGGSGGSAGDAGGTGGMVCSPNNSEPCYDGPPDTEGVGPCKAGTKTCNESGDGFGPCDSAVVPLPENCDTIAHESCKEDITGDCGIHLWARHAGDPSHQRANGVAVNGNGDPLIVGTFAGQVDFGSPCAAVDSKGNTDTFIARLDGVTGACVWAKQFGGAADQTGHAIAATGNSLYITGSFEGAAGFPDNVGGCPVASAGGKDLFVARLDASTGNCLWIKALGNSAEQTGNSIAVDAAGNALVSGTFAGSLMLDACAISTTGSADSNVFALKIDSAGQCIWARQLGNQFYQHAEDIATAGGAVALTGGFVGTLTSQECSPTMNNGTSYDNIFLTRFADNGTCDWNKDFGNSGIEAGQTVAMDAVGNTYAAGTMGGEIDFGGCLLTADGGQVFLLQMDAAGQCKHGALSTGSGARFAADLAIGAGGPDQIFLAGYFGGTLDFGAGSLTSINGDDAFVTRLTADLTPLWSKAFGGTGTQHATGIAVDAQGNAVVVGYFTGSTDLGDVSPAMSAGGEDLFVVKLGK